MIFERTWALIDDGCFTRELGIEKEDGPRKVRRRLTEYKLVAVPCYAVTWDG